MLILVLNLIQYFHHRTTLYERDSETSLE